jgi:chromate transporter
MDFEKKAARCSLATLSLLFLRIGATAFGGPAAHIPVIRQEVVLKRKWLTEQEFLDLLSVTNLIPGPNSTEMAIHIGYQQRGLPGLVMAGICFILPAALTVTLIAALYSEFGKLAMITNVLNGMKPVIIAVIWQALAGLSTTAIKEPYQRMFAIPLLFLCFLSIDGIAILLIGGSLSILNAYTTKPRRLSLKLSLFALTTALALGCVIAYYSEILRALGGNNGLSLAAVFLYFLRIGSVLYGSGYVLLAFLDSDLVKNWHWLTSSQLIDAAAVGQITPGPVFTTATFIGYLLAGPSGALVATIGIFLPAFIFVALTAPFISQLRKSVTISQFLDGVNIASLALMATVSIQLCQDAVKTPVSLVELLVSCWLLWRLRVNSIWLLLAGGIAGALTRA